MPLNFNNATLLSYSQQGGFFGENLIRYRNVKNIEIEGLILNLTNSSGVSGYLTGVQALEYGANDWQSFIVNGVNFGSGVINDIRFDSTNGVRQGGYSVSFSVFETGNVLNFPESGIYSGINFNNYKFLENLTENISFSKDFEKSIYDHSIQVKNLTSNKSGSIALAKSIAQNLFNSNNITGVIGGYINLANKKAIYQENYDQLTADCSFSKKIEYFNDSLGDYTINKNYVYNRGEDGVITVSEKGEIIALEQNYLDILTREYKIAEPLAYNNCLAIFNAYKKETNYTLINDPIVKGTSLDRYRRILSYELSFNNNLNNQNGYFWQYSHQSDLSDNGLVTTSEQGSIIGKGLRVNEKYNNAVNAYNNIIQLDIYTRSFDAYDRYINALLQSLDIISPHFWLIQKSESYLKHQGNINYSYQYNNDQTIIEFDADIIKADIVVDEGFRIPISQAFNIFNYKEIEQVSKSYEVANKNVTINLKGKRSTTMESYLTYAQTLASLYSAGTEYLNSANYSFSPYTNSFSLNVGWIKIFEA